MEPDLTFLPFFAPTFFTPVPFFTFLTFFSSLPLAAVTAVVIGEASNADGDELTDIGVVADGGVVDDEIALVVDDGDEDSDDDDDDATMGSLGVPVEGGSPSPASMVTARVARTTSFFNRTSIDLIITVVISDQTQKQDENQPTYEDEWMLRLCHLVDTQYHQHHQ
jgi:hypothetical protein